MSISAHPLAWPEGWKRTTSRRDGRFTSTSWDHSNGNSVKRIKALSMDDAIRRLRDEFVRLKVDFRDDVVISTNLALNLSGQPRANQGDPRDPGVAVYWQSKDGRRVMAIDIYNRVADNIGAVAASLEALRAIERHGGARVLERAFTGFTALPAPKSHWDILGLHPGTSREDIELTYRSLAKKRHPDNRETGSAQAMAELTAARDAAIREVA